LVDYSTTHSTPDRQVYVSLHGEESTLGSQADRYADESLDQISDDELLVNKTRKTGNDATVAMPLAEGTRLLELSAPQFSMDREIYGKTWTKQPATFSTVL